MTQASVLQPPAHLAEAADGAVQLLRGGAHLLREVLPRQRLLQLGQRRRLRVLVAPALLQLRAKAHTVDTTVATLSTTRRRWHWRCTDAVSDEQCWSTRGLQWRMTRCMADV